MVTRAKRWRWSSLWHRVHATQVPWLTEGPLLLPATWTEHVNGAETESELEALRRSVVRGAPYGDADWQTRTATKLGLESALRPQGRPKKRREAKT